MTARPFIPWFMAALCLVCVGTARADEKLVSVMTLLNDSGDDKVALALTDALRQRAREQDGWWVNDTRQSLSQLALVHDCDPAEAACLEVVAEAVNAAVLLVGTMGPTGEGQLHVQMQRYERGVGFHARTAHADLSAEAPPYAALAIELIEQLAPEPEQATEVALAPVVEDAGDDMPEVELVPAGSVRARDDLAWLGYTLVGTGAVSAGLMLYSWVQIDAAQGNEAFRDYRERVGDQAPQVDDVCDEADSGTGYGLGDSELRRVQGLCAQGRRHAVMQYVFMGVAAVAGTAGGIILWQSRDAGEHARLTLEPEVGPAGVSLGARLRM